MMAFSFMVSAIFSEASSASAVAGIVWFVMYFPYLFTFHYEENMWKYTGCVFTNTAMAFGFEKILRLEMCGDGLQWSNLFSDKDEQLTAGSTIFFLIGQALIYSLIALIVEKKKTRNFRVSKISTSDEPSVSGDPLNFEDEPQLQQIGVQVMNLGKTFGEKVACKTLTMNMYENQITVLLGNNGENHFKLIILKNVEKGCYNKNSQLFCVVNRRWKKYSHFNDDRVCGTNFGVN